MSTRPTRKQPAKKKPAIDAEKVTKVAAAAKSATTKKGKKGSKKKKISVGMAVVFCILVVAGGFGYFLTGKTIDYYFAYADDVQSEFYEEGSQASSDKYLYESLDTIKHHIFSSTDLLKINDYFEDENLQNWRLNWYIDKDCTIPAEVTKVGFGDLFKKEQLYGLLTEEIVEENQIPPYEGTYYNNVTWTVDGLYTRLRDGFMATNYNFAGKGRALIEADTPVGENKVYGIYTAQQFDQDWKSGKNFEREHVWCNSLLGMNRVTSSGKNQASDLHNLRAIGGTQTGAINQSRSNRYFVDCPSTCNEDGDNNPDTHPGHKVGTGAFYPGIDHVGDVSRILMYMIVMYKDILKVPASEADIIAAADHAYAVEYAYMPVSDFELILTWHNADPVDSFETHRNEVIYGFQGNRNPFIDHPDKLSVVHGLLAA